MREEKLLSLEQAVKKKMSDTAAQFNLAGRETIHEKALPTSITACTQAHCLGMCYDPESASKTRFQSKY